MKKTGLSKDEIDRMFAEMYDAVKSMSNEPSDPELDNLIDDLIRKNQRRKLVEQKSPYVVKPSVRQIAESNIKKSSETPTQEIGRIVVEKAGELFSDDNVKQFLDSSKNVFSQLWNKFVNWITVDEDEKDEKESNNNQQEVNNHV